MTDKNSIIYHNKIFLWLALATGGFLFVPLIATQYSNDVNWGPFDFLVMGILLFTSASLFILIARKISRKYWLISGAIILVLFLWIYVELAVGLFTN
ncbi:hypothetical protein [Aliikangiella sp. G2MR2-5]|uniref:hypothetical protein n=1 Tax=Aliikangiella sp. G2MR2-5 TaxID=2788943 RepID=UPI001AEE5DD3|nr:hypothetical protein [Aliikangiella sp. G2MR2-5]